MAAGFIITGLITTGITLSVPKFIQVFLDRVFPEKNVSLFILLTAVVLVLVVVMLIAKGQGAFCRE